MSCLACVAGAWKWWAQERTGRASETRVSSRAHVLPYMLQGHVSQAPFHSYGVRRHLVNRARNDVFHKKQREVIFDWPRQLPPKVREMTASSNSPPSGPKGWTCPRGCPGSSNKVLLNRASMTF